MGANLSRGEARRLEHDFVDVPTTQAKIFDMHPGLDRTVAGAFALHDLQKEGTLDYDVLEPVLRHILMKVGFLEFVVRFANADGSLNTTFVEPYFTRLGVNCRRSLSLYEWRSVVTAWIELVHETRAADSARWQEEVTRMQEEQALKFKRAMETFQDEYIVSL
eukprot:Lankesteria_metandrocarpae@DN8641_c0_g1_i1.p1